MGSKIAVLAGDGIGPENIAEAVKVFQCLQSEFGFEAELIPAVVGGAGYDALGDPLPESTLERFAPLYKAMGRLKPV